MGHKKTSKVFPFPEDFQITERMREIAKKNNWQDLEFQFEKFRAHHTALGSLMADWEAAWRTWMYRQVEIDAARARRSFGNNPPAPFRPSAPRVVPKPVPDLPEPSEAERRANIGKLSEIADKLGQKMEMPPSDLSKRREELKRQAALLRQKKS